MREEVDKASNFLTGMLKNSLIKLESSHNLNQNQLLLDKFKNTVNNLLYFYYQEHWFPTNPNKGSGYRCIRINHKMDPIISKAGFECGMTEEYLKSMFPSELTMWVDPDEVSYRIGENGSICQLYKKMCSNHYKPIDQIPKTPSIKCERIKRHSDSSDSDGSCSPMSISPSSPRFSSIMNCNDEFRIKNPDFQMENGNLPLVCCQLN